MRFRVIILDFDGTIVESVGIKDAAFRELFRGYPEHLDEIMAYHLSHNATIRFEKFEFIYRNILKQPYGQNIKEDLSRRFSDLVFNEIVECPFVEGALEFLEHFVAILPLYLVSMSPEEELIRILREKALAQYFKNVYYSSWKKVDAIDDICRNEAVLPIEAVFVGDTYEDFQAAKSMNVPFVGRNSKKSFFDSTAPIFEDLHGVLEFVWGNDSVQ